MRTQTPTAEEDILLVAHRIFSDEGFGVPTEHIARSASVRTSDIQERFGNKGGLFLAAMAPPTDGIQAALDDLEPTDALEDQMGDIAVLLFDYFRELAPILYVLATDLQFDYEAALRQNSTDPQRHLHGLLANFLGRHPRLDGVDESKLNAAILNLFSTLHSLAFFEALGAYGEECPEEVVRQQASLLTQGLLGSVSRP